MQLDTQEDVDKMSGSDDDKSDVSECSNAALLRVKR